MRKFYRGPRVRETEFLFVTQTISVLFFKRGFDDEPDCYGENVYAGEVTLLEVRRADAINSGTKLQIEPNWLRLGSRAGRVISNNLS